MLVAVLSATTNGNKPSDPDQRHHFYEVWIAYPWIKMAIETFWSKDVHKHCWAPLGTKWSLRINDQKRHLTLGDSKLEFTLGRIQHFSGVSVDMSSI